MIHILPLLCCMFGVTFSASLLDHSANQELARYMYRSKIIHQRLLAEGCADVTAARDKRSLLKGETQLEIEKQFYDELTDMLISCRQAKQSNSRTTTPTPTTTPTSTTTTTITTTPLSPQPEECQQAMNLTESWRVDHSGSTIRPGGSQNCDNSKMEAAGRPWFRFKEASGNMLLDHCVPVNSCGTHIALWSDEVMPTQVGVATRFNLFGSWGECKYDTLESSVMRCSDQPHDFIYRWEINSGKKHSCTYGFCGMNADI